MICIRSFSSEKIAILREDPSIFLARTILECWPPSSKNTPSPQLCVILSLAKSHARSPFGVEISPKCAWELRQ